MAWLERASRPRTGKTEQTMPTTDGICGSTTCRNVCQGVAPRSRAGLCQAGHRPVEDRKHDQKAKGRGPGEMGTEA